MRSTHIIFLSAIVMALASCSTSRKTTHASDDASIVSHIKIKNKVAPRKINTRDISADALVDFAETLEGVPYKYGSSNKEKGFDCSGFINYVFNHYSIAVPRSSVDWTNAGKEVSARDCKRGDIILFTGSDPASGVVGHMGIISSNKGNKLLFIHAASGGNKGVMFSGMSDYFVRRFVKIIRIFPPSR